MHCSRGKGEPRARAGPLPRFGVIPMGVSKYAEVGEAMLD